MGVRPQMLLIFGVDDYEGPVTFDCDTILDIAFNDNDSTLSYISDLILVEGQKTEISMSKLVYWGGAREGDKRLLGLVLAKTPYDSDIVRALAVVMPQFMKDGKLDIPTLIPDENPILQRRVSEIRPFEGIPFQWTWFYSSVLEGHRMYPIHASCLRYLLNRVGMDVDYHRYKLMLVWDWA